jgi:GntR family transcriptional regulator
MSSIGTAYHKLYNYLHQRIIENEFKSGDKLPSERELCEMFGVSRITCRRALAMLQDHGLIHRYPGIGTFVSEKRMHKVPILDSDYSASMRSQLPETKRTLLTYDYVIPPKAYQDIFGILQTEKCLLLERLDQIENEPLSFDRGYIPAPLATAIDREMAVEIEFLDIWMEKQGLAYSYVNSSLEAIEADEIAASRLKCKIGNPMLQTVEIFYTKEGKALAIFESIYRGDRFKFISTKVREAAKNTWK